MIKKISTSIPAHLSDFEVKGQLTKATLKVFHLGATADGRLFTESFANKLKATIGGTPIVAKYDAEAEDFIGHASTQAVFGFVPEFPSVKFEDDKDGNSWLVTEVRLFTKREDVGTIARLIPGKAQSLELDPNTVKYNFKEDEFGGNPQIELTDGDLIGLSVLGDHQGPAFRGSAFFTSVLNENVDLKQVIDKYLSIQNFIEIDGGGESVKKEIFETEEARTKRLEEEGAIVIETLDPTPTEPEQSEPLEPQAPETPVEPEPKPEPEPEPEPEAPEEGDGEDPETVADPVDTGDADAGEGEFESEENEEGEVENESNEEESFIEVGTEGKQDTPDSAALNNEERAELESYRLQHKEQIIQEYEDFLSEEVLKEFKEKVSDYTITELEGQLALKGMAAMRKAKKEEQPAQTSFVTFTPSRQAGKDPLKTFISGKL